jgi:plastocyanin
MRFTTTLLLLTLLFGLSARATVYDVKIGLNGANSYDPQNLTIKVGDAVRFVWVSGTHPTMSDSSPAAWATFTPSATNTNQTFTFSQAGSYNYHCTAHAAQSGTTYIGMIGNITVQTALAAAPAQAIVPTLTLFPNPSRGPLTVQVAGQRGQDYKLRLTNILGREVRVQAVRPEQAADGLAIDLSGLPAGLYFYSLLVNDKVVATKRLTLQGD